MFNTLTFFFVFTISTRSRVLIIAISVGVFGLPSSLLLSFFRACTGFYRGCGSILVGRLAGTIKGPFKSTRHCLEG